MSKVAIVLFNNIKYCPYLKFYTYIFDSCNEIDYDVIYYNRDKELNEPNDEKYHSIDWMGKSFSHVFKLFNFINFKFKVEKILIKNKYDYVIILTTLPGILLTNFLKKNFYKKYILDIRDYTYENIKIYSKIEQKLIFSSDSCVISSPDYINFLPNYNYLICHNIDTISVKDNVNLVFKHGDNNRIIISYIGSISYENQCIKLINLVFKDFRFEFHFYGNDSKKIVSNFVEKLNCDRIRMFGPFKPDEKKKIYSKSDLVFNCYGNDNTLVKFAVSNKYYDGAIFHKPLLVSPNTTMNRLGKCFSFPLDLDNCNSLDDLFDWYKDFDEKDYNKYAKSIVDDALSCNSNTANIIINKIIDK